MLDSRGQSRCAALDLDFTGSASAFGLPVIDARIWGPKLRCFATPFDIEVFSEQVARELPPFILSGSGDFHHLSAIFLGKIATPVVLVSFDNHPDWDIRPPRWACGGWISRALEQKNVRHASVWGCGNFELSWPHRLFANRAWKTDRLTVHAWAERQSPSVQKRIHCMTRDNWRARFTDFAESLEDSDVYLTVDLDALCEAEAVTNWEAGLFEAADVAWAIRQLRASANIVAGDICGAWSSPTYARWKQRFAAEWDRPKKAKVIPDRAAAINLRAIETIWPEMTGANEESAG